MVEHEERSGGFAVGGARLFARVPNTHLVPKAHGFFFILFFPLGKRKTSHPKQNQKDEMPSKSVFGPTCTYEQAGARCVG